MSSMLGATVSSILDTCKVQLLQPIPIQPQPIPILTQLIPILTQPIPILTQLIPILTQLILILQMHNSHKFKTKRKKRPQSSLS